MPLAIIPIWVFPKHVNAILRSCECELFFTVKAGLAGPRAADPRAHKPTKILVDFYESFRVLFPRRAVEARVSTRRDSGRAGLRT